MDFASQDLAGMTFPEIAVWKTVKLGLHKSPDEYRKALKKADCKISFWADSILDGISCSQQETEVDLVIPSVEELCFVDGAYHDAVCAKGIEMGLELCPAEVGPALRLSYKDQPRGELLSIAMEAITDSDGYSVIFSVFRDVDPLWLDGSLGPPEFFWRANVRFVFLRRRS